VIGRQKDIVSINFTQIGDDIIVKQNRGGLFDYIEFSFKVDRRTEFKYAHFVKFGTKNQSVLCAFDLISYWKY